MAPLAALQVNGRRARNAHNAHGVDRLPQCNRLAVRAIKIEADASLGGKRSQHSNAYNTLQKGVVGIARGRHMSLSPTSVPFQPALQLTLPLPLRPPVAASLSPLSTCRSPLPHPLHTTCNEPSTTHTKVHTTKKLYEEDGHDGRGQRSLAASYVPPCHTATFPLQVHITSSLLRSHQQPPAKPST